MDSVLRDIDREQLKMRGDVDNLYRHYEKLAGFVYQHLEQATIEWARLVVSHPKAVLLVVETTHIVGKHGYSLGGSEPIRLTTLSLANGEIWDQLLSPSLSESVQGVEYHGLTRASLTGQPTINQAWPDIAEVLDGCHIIIFNADYARSALQTVYQTHMLDDAYCLHNKCKEYYREFYELSLEKVLSYQGIDKKRDELTDSHDRLLVLQQVMNNLAAGMTKQTFETLDSLGDLEDHPF